VDEPFEGSQRARKWQGEKAAMTKSTKMFGSRSSKKNSLFGSPLWPEASAMSTGRSRACDQGRHDRCKVHGRATMFNVVYECQCWCHALKVISLVRRKGNGSSAAVGVEVGHQHPTNNSGARIVVASTHHRSRRQPVNQISPKGALLG